ncbi:hypothetical protein HY988_04200 [Candidatus Micrarchaeota archaeon]|nr:hypothetical protein [Candidatus Micrarchaeota archaeon]
MKKLEITYRYILEAYFQEKQTSFTQSELARKFSFSLSTINNAIKPLVTIGAVEIKQRSFVLLDAKKLLYYWATRRKFNQEIIYQTRADKPIAELEKLVPSTAIFTAFSAYRLKFSDAPADYSEMYFYIPGQDLNEVKKRFPEAKGPANVFVLISDAQLIEENLKEKGNLAPSSQIFVDLWNIKEWYAQEFFKKLEQRLFND